MIFEAVSVWHPWTLLGMLPTDQMAPVIAGDYGNAIINTPVPLIQRQNQYIEKDFIRKIFLA